MNLPSQELSAIPTSLFIFKSYSTNLSKVLLILLQNFLMTVLTAFLEAFPEGARDPEKSMDAKKAEGADQQAGHGPERIEQEGILIPVMMGGMGQVTGKFTI